MPERERKVKCAVIYTGGKDSHLALLRALDGGREAVCLMYIDGGARHTEHFNDQRKMEALRLHSSLSGIPLFVKKAGAGFDPKKAAEVFRSLIAAARERYEFSEVVSGSSKYDDGLTPERLAGISEKLGMGIPIVTPLGNCRLEDNIAEMSRLGVSALVTGVNRRVPAEWLGRPLDGDFLRFMLDRRRRGVAIGGPDIQTLVTGSPIFAKDLRLEKAGILEEEHNTFWSFSARTAAKNGGAGRGRPGKKAK